jgi:hypothetical protein
VQKAIAGNARVVYQNLNGPGIGLNLLHASGAGIKIANIPGIGGNFRLLPEFFGGGLIASKIDRNPMPACFSAQAMAAPMPRVPPVTNATRLDMAKTPLT